jgi:hypothetical protein
MVGIVEPPALRRDLLEAELNRPVRMVMDINNDVPNIFNGREDLDALMTPPIIYRNPRTGREEYRILCTDEAIAAAMVWPKRIKYELVLIFNALLAAVMVAVGAIVIAGGIYTVWCYFSYFMYLIGALTCIFYICKIAITETARRKRIIYRGFHEWGVVYHEIREGCR